MDRNMRNLRQFRARAVSGFTLVELLVVIGIIALLISILLPSLNRARQMANLIYCQSNLRQVGQLVQLYAASNNGYLPPLNGFSVYTYCIICTNSQCLTQSRFGSGRANINYGYCSDLGFLNSNARVSAISS